VQIQVRERRQKAKSVWQRLELVVRQHQPFQLAQSCICRTLGQVVDEVERLDGVAAQAQRLEGGAHAQAKGQRLQLVVRQVKKLEALHGRKHVVGQLPDRVLGQIEMLERG